MSRRSRHKIALATAAVMTVTSLPLGPLQAGMISTDQIIQPAGTDHDVEQLAPRERVQAFLARDDVRAEMIALGVSPSEAEARVAAMTDTELASLAGRLDQLPAGEGLGLGTALIIGFIVFGITVMLDAFGMINIFPFVCGPGECGAGPQQAYYPEPAAGPVVEEQYGRPERRPSYRRDQFDDTYSRRRDQRYETNEYYEPAPVRPARNYYEERFGTQRYVR